MPSPQNRMQELNNLYKNDISRLKQVIKRKRQAEFTRQLATKSLH